MTTCDNFDSLVERARTSSLDDEEWDSFLDHESNCARHAQAAAQRQPSDEDLIRSCLARLELELQKQRSARRLRVGARRWTFALAAAAALLVAAVALWPQGGNITRTTGVLELGAMVQVTIQQGAVVEKVAEHVAKLESGPITVVGQKGGEHYRYGIYLGALDAAVEGLGTKFDVNMMYLKCDAVSPDLRSRCKNGQLPVALVTMYDAQVKLGHAKLEGESFEFTGSECSRSKRSETCYMIVDAAGLESHQAYILPGGAPRSIRVETVPRKGATPAPRPPGDPKGTDQELMLQELALAAIPAGQGRELGLDLEISPEPIQPQDAAGDTGVRETPRTAPPAPVKHKANSPPAPAQHPGTTTSVPPESPPAGRDPARSMRPYHIQPTKDMSCIRGPYLRIYDEILYLNLKDNDGYSVVARQQSYPVPRGMGFYMAKERETAHDMNGLPAGTDVRVYYQNVAGTRKPVLEVDVADPGDTQDGCKPVR